MAKLEATYEFGDVRVDAASELVSRSGTLVLLEPKAFELLIYFIQHRGRLLDKRDILDAVWGETFVSENALTRVVAQLRKALGDEAHHSKYIETVPRRGYRFIAPIDSESTTVRKPSPQRWVIPAGLAGFVVLAAKGLQLLSLRTAEAQTFTFPPEGTVIWDHDPAFSPDGETMAFVRGPIGSLNSGALYVMPSAGGEPRKLTFGSRQIRGFDWTPDGTALVFASPRHAGLETELWKVPVADGEPVRIEGTQGARHPSLARDRLAYSREVRDWNVWRVGGPNALEPTVPEKLIASTRDDFMAEYSPNGAEIALVSDRDGELAIWITQADGTGARKLVGDTRDTALSPFIWAGPRWSPTGDEIVYGGRVSESNLEVFAVNARGGPARNVTASEFIEARPSWSPDGRWIYFQSLRTGIWEIWRVPSEGGQAIQITRGGGLTPYALPNDVYYWNWSAWQIRRTGPEGEKATVVVDERTNKWTVWNGKIVYIVQRETETVIELFDPESETTRQIASLGESPSLWFGLSVSPDGQWILYTQNDNPGSDILLVENFR